jgi:hypothetical protein
MPYRRIPPALLVVVTLSLASACGDDTTEAVGSIEIIVSTLRTNTDFPTRYHVRTTDGTGATREIQIETNAEVTIPDLKVGTYEVALLPQVNWSTWEGKTFCEWNDQLDSSPLGAAWAIDGVRVQEGAMSSLTYEVNCSAP